METEINMYGLAEGVFKACQYLGLKFPPALTEDIQIHQEHTPSDYFGNDFSFNMATLERISNDLNCSRKSLAATAGDFAAKYSSQRCFNHNLTDLNVYFVDYLLFVMRQTGANASNYFAYEFYKKSFAVRAGFITDRFRKQTQRICQDHSLVGFTTNKTQTNKIFNKFLKRDWLNTYNCTFGEFNAFVQKHPNFFLKPIDGSLGKNTKIVHTDSSMELKNVFETLKHSKSLLEEIIPQHESLREFCPSSLNTIRVNTFLDVHNVVHILTASGKFGRIGKIIDNFHGGGVYSHKSNHRNNYL